MTAEELGGLIRTVVAFAGGYFVSKGVIDNATLLSIAGAVSTLAVAGWSVWAKRKAA